jgi:hypothetical protein
MDADLYRQRFAELIVRERDIAGQFPTKFAYGYAPHREAMEQRQWPLANLCPRY